MPSRNAIKDQQQQIEIDTKRQAKTAKSVGIAHRYHKCAKILKEFSLETIKTVQEFMLNPENEGHAAHIGRVMANKCHMQDIAHKLLKISKADTHIYLVTVGGFPKFSSLTEAYAYVYNDLLPSLHIPHTGVVVPEIAIKNNEQVFRYDPHFHAILSIADNDIKPFKRYLKSITDGSSRAVKFEVLNEEPDVCRAANYLSKHSQTYNAYSNKRSAATCTTIVGEAAALLQLNIKASQMLMPTGEIKWCAITNQFKIASQTREQAALDHKTQQELEISGRPVVATGIKWTTYRVFNAKEIMPKKYAYPPPAGAYF
jgi:hypothetical protein